MITSQVGLPVGKYSLSGGFHEVIVISVIFTGDLFDFCHFLTLEIQAVAAFVREKFDLNFSLHLPNCNSLAKIVSLHDFHLHVSLNLLHRSA